MKKVLICMMVVLFMLSFAACAQSPVAGDAADEADEIVKDTIEPDSENEDAEESPKIDESWLAIEEKGSFILGFDAGFAPMGFKDESGEYVGFDIDLAKEVASRLGLEIVYQPIDWDAKFMELNNGNIDLVWNGLTITEDRKKEVLFSDPYMNNQQIIVVSASSGIATKADLAGKVVAAQIDSSAMEAINNEADVMATFGELIQSPDYVEALTELKMGTVDAVVVDEMTGRYYVLADHATEYVVLEDTFGDEQYGIGFRMNNVAFRDKIQETLNEMIKDGTAKTISEKWFGDNVIIGG